MSEFFRQAESLIDLHLGRLEPEEAEALTAAMSASPELRAQSDACRRLLAELDASPPPEPPADLVNRVLDRIAASEALIPFPAADQPVRLPSGMDRRASAPVISLRELATIAACIALFVGIFIPGYHSARARSQRSVCQQNMQQIAAGLFAYAQSNADFLPWAGSVPGGSWLPVRTPGVPRASNTRHAYLLLREGFVTNARVFVCPGSGGLPMRTDNYRLNTDFAEAANCTYSIQNANVDRPQPLGHLPGRMGYLADANPYFRGQPAHSLLPRSPENSSAHNPNAGQNVLSVNGRTAWVTRPTVGVNNDHIYRAGTLTHYVGTELPKTPTDSFLVP